MAKTAKTFISIAPLSLTQIKEPLTLFSALANQPWSMWLDSCESDHEDANFDVMVFNPLVTLQTQALSTRITWQNQENAHLNQESEADPLSLLKQVQDDVFADISLPKASLPFIGGALGYFAYDLGQRFEQLPAKAIRDIALPEMAVGIYLHAIIFDRKTNEFVLVCPDEKRQEIEQQLLHLLHQQQEDHQHHGFSLQTDWQANLTKSQYCEKFKQVQEYLLSGDCYQINLAQRFHAQYQGDEFDAYLALRAANKAPFSAFIRLEDAAVLSISPERFLKLTDNKVQSKPIKGTKPRASAAAIDQQNAIDLQHSEKDRAENLMIVDLLRNDISKVCLPGSVKVPKLFDIESFPAVHHLVSTVEGQLESHFSTTDLLRGAFPGGSITGAPKIRAMEVIDELEPHHRSIYCGSIGYISACGNMDTSITIRTLACKNQQIYCWAGGGLVADSTADSEYQETFDKVAKILPVLSQL
ncbi:aminodeoxychorismate synthase component I [Thalassotalea sp. PLHSN55]|uniref:aminodeoxychorismate synthase component I n=1 Tax=Thalassotalea sp. PLHSN55 TaxID=3435888 RepID=UPI003F86F6E4